MVKVFEHIRANKWFYLSTAAIYIVILIPSLYTPMQSDDYSYCLKSLSLVERFRHYNHWSGRFITDLIASILLQCFSHTAYEMINALAFVVMLVFTSLIPNALNTENNQSKAASVTLWFVFMLYWLGNPNLGQTSFWIVGSANYLWTIMWGALYIFTVLHYLESKQRITPIKYLVAGALALGAGLSNESTSISLVLFTGMLFFFYPDRRTSLIIPMISVMAGSALLMLAPGNFVRLQDEAFRAWRSKSVLSQVYFHLTHRMPDLLGSLGIGISFIGIFAAVFFLLRNKIARQQKRFIALFAILSGISLLIFSVSPAVPPRAINTTLFLLLPVAAILSHHLHIANTLGNKALIRITLTAAALLFVPSYLLLTRAYRYTYIQSEMHQDIIFAALKDGKTEVHLPDWHFTGLLRNGDKFDKYKSEAMCRYYRMDTINWDSVHFNYAKLRSADRVIYNVPVADGLKPISLYKQGNGREYKLIFEFNARLSDYASAQEDTLRIHLMGSGHQAEYIKDGRIKECSRIGDSYYYVISASDESVSGCQRIIFGLCGGGKGTDCILFSVPFSGSNKNDRGFFRRIISLL